METEWLKFKVAGNCKFKPLKQYMLLIEMTFRINLPRPSMNDTPQYVTKTEKRDVLQKLAKYE